MNEVSPEQAKEMLADIDQMARRIRKTLAASALAPNLMVWGAVWAIGFTATFLNVARHGWFWAGLIAVGAVLTFIITWRAARERVVVSDEEKRLSWQIFWFWVAVLGYATALLFVRPPREGQDVVVTFVMLSMLGYVVMGIWVRSLALAVIGLFVTATMMVGRLGIDQQYFMPWMAVFGGGGLFMSGVYIRLRWR